MVRALSGPDHVITVATTDADGADGQINPRDYDFGVCELHIFKRNFSESWKVSFGLALWLIKNISKYDVVHIHAIWSFSSTVSALLCRYNRVKYILRPAGMLSLYSWGYKSWKKNIYWHLLEKYTVHGASSLHVTSDDEKKDVSRKNISCQIYTIPNGVEESAFSEKTKNDLACLGIDYNLLIEKNVLLFMSRLHPVKGVVDRLLPAVKELGDQYVLLLAGSVDSHAREYGDEVEEYIRDKELADKVVMLGAIDGDDRWSLFRYADLFILPSHSENYGVVVVEAMACGCPVIVTSEVQSASIVKEAMSGIVVDGDVSELKKAIQQAFSDDKVRRDMSVNGMKYTKENLRWPIIAEKISDMYDEVVG